MLRREQLPALLNHMAGNKRAHLAPEEIEQRRQLLRSYKLTEKAIAALEKQKPDLYDAAEIQNRLVELQSHGFAKPEVLINKMPTILALTTARVRAQINDLKTIREVTDWTPLIETCPAILTYSFSENIAPKLRVLRRLIRMYEVPVQLSDLIRRNSSVLTSSREKLLVLARILRSYARSPHEVSHTMVRDLMFTNLEDVMLAVVENEGNDIALTDLVAEAKDLADNNSHLSREDKRGLIADHAPVEGSVEDAILARYHRGFLSGESK